jgi:hypothetical protein
MFVGTRADAEVHNRTSNMVRDTGIEPAFVVGDCASG